MPRKPTTAKPKPRTAKPVRETAVAAARRVHAERPSPETLGQYQDILYRDALAAADADITAEYRTLVAEAETVATSDPAWSIRVACVHARGGQLKKLAGVTSSVVAGHLADWAVRTEFRGAIPSAEQPAFDAIQSAFRAYEAGDDGAARDALAGVGLASAFLEWKLLLRGLMAYSAGDDDRSVENWRRLAPDRIPTKLAAPFRIALDQTFARSLPADELSTATARRAALLADPVTTKLRALRGQIGRDNKSLSSAWAIAEAVLPLLRAAAPHLVPRLGRCLYFAVSKQGEPADLPKYKRLFGPPPFDPDFCRLEAVALEDSDYLGEANAKWAKFEAWLAGPPAGWPRAVADRARAVTLLRMGDNAADLHESAGGPTDDLRAAFEQLFPAARRARPAGSPPADYLRRAVALAPDWPPASLALFDSLAPTDEAAAELVARDLLDKAPNNLPALEALATLLFSQGRVHEAAECRHRALATNPLDRRLRVLASHAVLAAARRYLLDGDTDKALAALDAGRDVGADSFPVGYFALRSVVLRKLKRPAEADADAAEARANPGGRVAAAFTIAVDGVLAKLKPADRKTADTAFKTMIAGPVHPLEVNMLYAAWDVYGAAGVTYRGQKTHEKTILDLCVRCLTSDGSPFDFENLLLGVVLRQQWKTADKIAAPLDARFPASAVTKVCLAEALDARGVRYMGEMRVHLLLNKASEILDAGPPDPRAGQLRASIDRLRAKYASPDDLFDFITDRRR